MAQIKASVIAATLVTAAFALLYFWCFQLTPAPAALMGTFVAVSVLGSALARFRNRSRA